MLLSKRILESKLIDWFGYKIMRVLLLCFLRIKKSEFLGELYNRNKEKMEKIWENVELGEILEGWDRWIKLGLDIKLYILMNIMWVIWVSRDGLEGVEEIRNAYEVLKMIGIFVSIDVIGRWLFGILTLITIRYSDIGSKREEFNRELKWLGIKAFISIYMMLSVLILMGLELGIIKKLIMCTNKSIKGVWKKLK